MGAPPVLPPEELLRRAMAAVKKDLKGSWWFDVWQPDAIAKKPADQRDLWVLKPKDKWHGFVGLAENHVLVDPIKVTILTPGLSADGTMQEHGIPAAVVTKFLSARRIEIEKTGLYSFLVLFSMGITKGKWSTLITELLNFKDLYDANAPIKRVLPALFEQMHTLGALRAHRGKGIGRTALGEITRFLFEDEQANRVQLSTDVENAAMRGAARWASPRRYGCSSTATSRSRR